MIARVVNLFFVLGITAIMSCVSTSTSSSGGRDGDHYEDLSAYRPDYKQAIDTMDSNTSSSTPDNEELEEVNPEYDVTEEVNSLLDSIQTLKTEIEYIDGYTIQVYTGIKRDDANEAKTTVYSILPDSRPVITYDQPNFKVKVGKFYSRREALKTFAELKNQMPAAIIIPEKIPVGDE